MMRFLFLLCFLPLLTVGVSAREILLVLTNHSQLGDTGKPTGFYLSEASHPWEVFTRAGYKVTLASPKGGLAPIDPKSLEGDDPANTAFLKAFGGGEKGIENVAALGEVDLDRYAAIFFAGGHGTMWDFVGVPAVKEAVEKVYGRGGVVAAVCHGPVALVEAKLPDGAPLVKGRKIAVFTNEEEDAVELTEVMPFLPESRFRELGAEVITAPKFTANAVRDGRLVTGQNPASATRTAELVVEALKSE